MAKTLIAWNNNNSRRMQWKLHIAIAIFLQYLRICIRPFTKAKIVKINRIIMFLVYYVCIW